MIHLQILKLLVAINFEYTLFPRRGSIVHLSRLADSLRVCSVMQSACCQTTRSAEDGLDATNFLHRVTVDCELTERAGTRAKRRECAYCSAQDGSERESKTCTDIQHQSGILSAAL